MGAFASQDKLPGQTQSAAVMTQLGSATTSTATVTATETGTAIGTSTTDTVTATPTGTVSPTVEPEDAHHGDCITTAAATAIATDTPTAIPPTTATAGAGETNDDQGDDSQGENGNANRDCDIKGIPSTNPNHHPESTPGVCQKGETVIKTTPSGEQVNVPCQPADKSDGHEDLQNRKGADNGRHD